MHWTEQPFFFVVYSITSAEALCECPQSLALANRSSAISELLSHNTHTQHMYMRTSLIPTNTERIFIQVEESPNHGCTTESIFPRYRQDRRWNEKQAYSTRTDRAQISAGSCRFPVCECSLVAGPQDPEPLPLFLVRTGLQWWQTHHTCRHVRVLQASMASSRSHC